MRRIRLHLTVDTGPPRLTFPSWFRLATYLLWETIASTHSIADVLDRFPLVRLSARNCDNAGYQKCSSGITALLSRLKATRTRFRSGFCSLLSSYLITCGGCLFCLGLSSCASSKGSPLGACSTRIFIRIRTV